MEVKDINLLPNHWHHLSIEKDDSSFRFYIDQKLVLSYVTHIPLAGTHLGLIHKDQAFEILHLNVYSSSHNVMVNCLAVPDAFLAKKDYNTAYAEYKRIAQSFPGRMEGLQAMFRAAVCLLEKAKAKNDKKGFQKALDELDNLHRTPGAPLEYLGKSLVYAALSEYEEEAKCLELAIRKFQQHPLLPILKEHLIYRIHESSLQDREAAYRLILLTTLHIPSLQENPDILMMIDNLKKHWEQLYFITSSKHSFHIELAYRLGRKHTLLELLKKIKEEEEEENPENEADIKNIYFALLELNAFEEVEKELDKEKYPLIALMTKCHQIEPTENEMKKFVSNKLSEEETKILIHIFKEAIDKNWLDFLGNYINRIKAPAESAITLDCLNIWYCLLKKDYPGAKKIFEKYPMEIVNNDNSLLHPLYGIWLYVHESPDIAMIHFTGVLETTYPKTTSLLSHFLTEKIDKWFKHALFFEKRELYRQLSLFYSCKEDQTKHNYFYQLSLQGI